MIMEQPDLITVDNDADEVSCDGGGGALGHPVVWYSFDGGDAMTCGYCSRIFVKKRSQSKYKAKPKYKAKHKKKKTA